MKFKILYVEDDESIAYLTTDGLEMKGYEVVHVMDGNQVLNKFKSQFFDICILDIMLPNVDGFEIARQIRQCSSKTPIIFLSAKASIEDKIEGLEIGADDYMTKPFSIKELVLRIEAILRRSERTNKCQNQLQDITFLKNDFKVTVGGKAYNLTARECELLQLFIDNFGQTLKRGDILLKLWGSDEFFLGRSLDVFISRLRKMLKNSKHLTIENIHGVGFRMVKK